MAVMAVMAVTRGRAGRVAGTAGTAGTPGTAARVGTAAKAATLAATVASAARSAVAGRTAAAADTDGVVRRAVIGMAMALQFAAPLPAQEARDAQEAPDARDAPDAREKGVLKKLSGAQPGYTLFAPFDLGDTYLIDLDGRVVHQWKSKFPPGQCVELLENGHLLRAARDAGSSSMNGGGAGGRIEEFDWDGKLVWSWECADESRRQHHDFERLPNGHVVVIAWEQRTRAEAVEAGRDPDAAHDGLWPDCLLEVKPDGVDGGTIVWEWHVWDHLIQDRDPAKPNFGVVAENPGRIDVNALRKRSDAPAPAMSEEDQERLRKLGYVGGDGEGEGGGESERDGGERPAPPRDERGRGVIRRNRFGMDAADWNHLNSVYYDATRDELVVSSHNQHEIWIVDHSTTTEEARGSTGGKRGQGGDLLWRWGNPRAWQVGTPADQFLFGQHDARFIEPGLRGAGRLLVFNNNVRGGMRGGSGEGRSSFVVELELPRAPDGSYAREPGRPFGPAQPAWRYGGGEGEATFYSLIVSGSQRLPNGNTLITSGAESRCIEVDAAGQVVWEWRSPFRREPQRAGEAERGGERPNGGGGAFAGVIYRAIRIPPDHPGLRGRKLEPRKGA